MNIQEKEMIYNKNLHKIIIVDFLTNIIIVLGALVYVCRTIFYQSDGMKVLASVILLVIALALLSYNAAYFYQSRKGVAERYTGMSRFMSIASVAIKVMVLFISVIVTICIGPGGFFTILRSLFR